MRSARVSYQPTPIAGQDYGLVAKERRRDVKIFDHAVNCLIKIAGGRRRSLFEGQLVEPKLGRKLLSTTSPLPGSAGLGVKGELSTCFGLPRERIRS